METEKKKPDYTNRKECPMCGCLIETKYTECPNCGEQFPEEKKIGDARKEALYK